ncbi:alpha,alpha-trehalose-phosphate synthase (UDP-forming) [Amorphus orientalis]|uniref:Trehalose 6-phosphate synthase n=1 Tax=Amorphus orientalis TaxID=649198 RepID=A0AAE4AU55_9HYPH|nr:trehalose-6-phosphate synthase [Amorphus orientalis]MDQ0316797.1 trehalose 6-phosphate synthase [Amorphus orientalis]
MGRLVVVSNRVGPLQDTGRAGGLAVALVDVLRERGGVWFGWSGKISEEGTFSPLREQSSGNVRVATIDLSETDYNEYYAGYANRCLWPTMHYRLDLTDFDRKFDEGYRRVNERFAARLKPLLEPDDIIWVHDYHFMLLGAQLRAMGVENPIGFFLHIPFPVPEVLTALPNHAGLVRSLLAYDLIGFQSTRDASALRRYLVEEAGADETSDGAMHVLGRKVHLDAFPIGIDAETFAGYAVSGEGQRNFRRLKTLLNGQIQMIGVDRIDYSKGLPERFRAVERLFEDYPENRGRVSFMQVAPPSRSEVRAYSDIQRTLEGLTGRINGKFSDIDWTPISFLTQSLPRRALAGIYRASLIGLVTPLRDGMNLVAKEYVAAQDPEDPGVLVLSRFAGAAEELREALIVNPYSIDAIAEALQTGIRMPQDERKERWERLYGRITKTTAASWSRTFIERLTDAAEHGR